MIDDVKPYARARMKKLGKTEWSDGFNFANIPRTLLDKSFHLELQEAQELSNNQDNLMVNQPFYLRLFRAQVFKVRDAIDEEAAYLKPVIDEFLAPKNRLTQPRIKNIVLNSVLIEKLDQSNDNGVIVKIAFTALVIRSTR